MSGLPPPAGTGRAEFVAITTTLMALVALSVDTVLPAFGTIAEEFALADDNRRQLIVTALFVGLAAGQLLYGPLSDAWGRKPAIYVGLGCFAAGSALSAAAGSFEALLLGRVLQGFGAAGPRIVAIAMVRDRFEGVEMARIMSVVIAAFITVPVVAPTLGQVALWHTSWRALFLVIGALGLLGGLWLALRQPETLKARRRFRFARFLRAVLEVLRTRRSVACTLAGACSYGALMGYVNTAQQVFQDTYGVGEAFPILFGGCAVFVALATLTNSAVVARFGMERICRVALAASTAWSATFLLIAVGSGGGLPLPLYLLFAGPAMFMLGLTFGNINAIALEPLGHIAGTASAVTATLSTTASLAIAFAIGAFFDGTAVPVVAGYAVMGLCSLALVAAAGRRRRA